MPALSPHAEGRPCHVACAQNRKAHRNGIKKPQKQKYSSTKGVSANSCSWLWGLGVKQHGPWSLSNAHQLLASVAHEHDWAKGMIA